MMMGYQLLGYFPPDVVAIALIVLCVAILIPGRAYYEGGLGYNVSLASQLGDIALIGCISTAASLIRNGCEIPPILNSAGFGWLCVIAAVLTAAVWQAVVVLGSGGKWGTAMDIYHNVFIAPLLVCLLLLALPVVFCCGSLYQKIWMLFLLKIFVILFIYDKKTGRLQQQDWLIDNGFAFVLKE